MENKELKMNFVNIAYYDKNDWGHLLSVVTDRHKMHNSWDDWFKDFIKTKTELN
jgi:hypothetical protein